MVLSLLTTQAKSTIIISMKMVTLTCDNPDCMKSFNRSMKEHRRSQKLERPEYCSSSCSAVFRNRSPKRTREITNKNLKPDNQRDKYSSFRWYMARIRYRRAKKGETDLNVQTLKALWDKQNGKCSFTGWDMVLPVSTTGKWQDGEKMRRASLDRIDNDKGYINGNVRFVCHIANVARNSFTDAELTDFCHAVASKHGEKAK